MRPTRRIKRLVKNFANRCKNELAPKKQREIEEEPADPFLAARPEELFPYVKANWKEGVNYDQMFGDAQVLVLGDTNHAQTGIWGGLAKHLSEMKTAGATHICIELPRGDAHLAAVKEFYENGDISKLASIAEGTWAPVRTANLFKTAKAAGLEAYLVDMPDEERDKKWSDEQTSERRGQYMGQKISELAAQTGSKIVALCGYSHLAKNQIPEQLQNKGIKYKKLALVTAGQPAHNILAMMTGLETLGAVAAVSNYNLQDRCGSVELPSSNYGVDGFIHFPRIQLVERPKGTELAAAQDENSILAAQNGNALCPLDENLNVPPFVFDFRNLVDPECASWEKTNRQKIFDVAGSIKTLNKTQQLYLALMLENYVRTSMRHSGGSILNIEFDPEVRAFGIDTVDTFGYPFNPECDYHGLARHREVTLTSLLKHFGFKNLLVKNVKDLPKTDIRPNPNNPESTYKWLLLLSASATCPECIHEFIGTIYINRIPRVDNHIVKLDFDDFELNDLEKVLFDFGKKFDNFYDPINDVKYYSVWKPEDKIRAKMLPYYRRDLKRTRHLLYELENIFCECRYPRILPPGRIEYQIVEARAKLQFLSRKTIDDYLLNAEKALQVYETKLNEIDKIVRRYPDRYNAKIDRDRYARKGHFLRVKDRIKHSVDLCTSLKKELSGIKAMYQTYDDGANEPNGDKALTAPVYANAAPVAN